MLLAATAAIAQQYPIAEGDLTVTETVLSAGSSVTISGEGFASGAEVVVTIESEPVELARVNADATGRFTATVVIPTNLSPGSHTLKASGPAAAGGTLVLTSQVFVEGELPFTGLSVPWWIFGVAAVAALIGAIAFRLARR